MQRIRPFTLTLFFCLAMAANASAAEPCFYGEESFTIVWDLTGMESGKITEHVMDCGRKRVEIHDTAMSVAGMTTKQKKRTIYDGAEVVTVDSASGKTTKMKNPMYDSLVQSMNGKDGVEFGKEIMSRMGGKPTGKTGTYAGVECDFWQIASLATESCVTSWGATLYTKATVMNMTSERVATSIKIGDPGPADAYAYEASKAQQQPDVAELMKLFNQGK